MIIPAIDLIGGSVVRLFKGDYSKKSEFAYDPVELARSYAASGARLLHLVDLEGAKDPSRRQTGLVSRIVEAAGLPVQTGGGIRSGQDARALLDAGAQRVVVGSLCVKDPEEVRRWFRLFGPERIVLALDVRIGAQGRAEIAVHGWQEDSGRYFDDLVSYFGSSGLRHVLCTDISKDGTLKGANAPLYAALHQKFPSIALQASGGIGSLEDIASVRASGAAGVIVGRALLEKRFTFEEADRCWQNA